LGDEGVEVCIELLVRPRLRAQHTP
jgi:hypothetical protein